MKSVSHGIDRIAVTFDDPNLVANAGLLLVSSVVKKLGLEALINEKVKIPSKLGGFAPGRKVLTLVEAMVAGATQVSAVSDDFGWRLGRIVDPFGHHWEVGKPLA